jgi:hypothetical protein
LKIRLLFISERIFLFALKQNGETALQAFNEAQSGSDPENDQAAVVYMSIIQGGNSK